MGAALRRFAILTTVLVVATAVLSTIVGLLFGAGISRSISLGWYIVGSILLILGFFVGNRGPARVKSEHSTSSLGMIIGGGRDLRWATPGEQNETINNSAVYIALGLILVAIGILFDSRHSLF